MNKKTFSTNIMVRLALMTAISIVLLLIMRIPFPPAPFLVYDPADVPIYMAAFAFGPVHGLIVTFVVCLIQAFALGGDGIYGFLMHFVATGAVAVIIGMMYAGNKTKKTAAVSLIVGIVACSAIMCAMNLIITPVFMGTPRAAVKAMLIPVIIPFNLIKAGINSLITFILYKRMSRFLHNEKINKKEKDRTV